MDLLDTEQLETNPYLPSGEWEGFYCYNSSPEQHKMITELNFKDGCVFGGGVDDVASFIWDGTYDTESYKIQMTKKYQGHEVFYKGDIDENGIWGTWEIKQDLSMYSPEIIAFIKEELELDAKGGFHLWPKKRGKATNSLAISEKQKSEKLEELFVQIFG